MRMELSGKRKRIPEWRRSKRSFMDAVREDMAVVEVTAEDANDRTNINGDKNPQWRPVMGEAKRRT